MLDASYAELIDAAKASFDFMLNSATLSLLLGVLLLTTGLVDPIALSSRGEVAAWIGETAGFFVLSRWFYTRSIESAHSWGNLVRGAFDLYRGKLLEKLGYCDTIDTSERERKLWGAISRRLAAGDPPQWSSEALPPYRTATPPPTSCSCSSGGVLTVTRGVRPAGPGQSWREIVLEARNPAGQGATIAEELVLVDAVPDGYDYQWDSAQASEGEVTQLLQ